MAASRSNSDAYMLKKLCVREVVSDVKPVLQMPSTSLNPWNKPEGHYEKNEMKMKLDDNSRHHKATKIIKVFKAGSSLERNKSLWVKVKNTNIDLEFRSRSNRLIVAFSQCMRFLVNNKQIPKYNIYQNLPVSKEIVGAIDLHDYLELENPVCLNGFARVLFARYLLLDDDLHFGNFFVKDDMLVGIDFDWGFSGVSHEFHEGLRIDVEAVDAKGIVCEKTVKRQPTHFPAFHVKDFEKFPYPETYKPTMYEFSDVRRKETMDMYNETEQFSYDIAFVLFKGIVGKQCLVKSIELSVDDKTDKDSLVKGIQAQFAAAKEQCKTSKKFTAFMNHVDSQRMMVLSVLLFEVGEFYKENRKYFDKTNKVLHMQAWEGCIASILDECSSLLKDYGKQPITEKERAELKAVANKIYENDVKAIESVLLYYKEKKLAVQVSIVEERLDKIKSVMPVVATSLIKP